jgi:endonuclease/exonuclease/phosphatase family metal-dependent hydrolase
MGEMRLLLLLLLSLTLYSQNLRVLSFNVRYPSKDDGANVWEQRRETFIHFLQMANADFIGAQELFALQGQYIVEKLPEYKWFGLSRRGNSEDEHMGIFYRHAKYDLLESGNFWLSPTPDVVMSSAWNMSLPRMVTWGRFRIKESGKQLYLVNTHFPHRRQDAEARLECAKVLAAFLAKLPAGAAIILTGDFNTDASGPVFELLTQRLTDARPANAGGTFHGFTGQPGQDRIDWILYSGPLQLTEARILDQALNGRFPSDHFPVLAAFSVR